jgi:hypothetical protein
MVPVFSFFTRMPRTSNFARPNQSYQFAISDPRGILEKDSYSILLVDATHILLKSPADRVLARDNT